MNKINCINSKHKLANDCFLNYDCWMYPREHDDICKMSLNEAYKKYGDSCDFKKLKILLTRLRRKSISGDWEEFRNIFETNSDYYINACTARVLVSILETYADYAVEPIKNNALLATQLSTADRWTQSINQIIYDLEKKEEPKINNQQQIYDGFITILFSPCDDAIEMFFNRMVRVLSSTPLVYKMWVLLIEKMFECDSSILSILNKEAQWDIKSEILRIIRN